VKTVGRAAAATVLFPAIAQAQSHDLLSATARWSANTARRAATPPASTLPPCMRTRRSSSIYGDGRLLATSTPRRRGAAAQKLEANAPGVKPVELAAGRREW